MAKKKKVKVGNMKVTNSGNLKNKLNMDNNDMELPDDLDAGNVEADNVGDVENEVSFSGNKAKSKWVLIIGLITAAAVAIASYYFTKAEPAQEQEIEVIVNDTIE